MLEPVILNLGLSDAKHLKDESCEFKIFYAGPRFTTGSYTLRTSSNPKISDVCQEVNNLGFSVESILLFCDIYSLSLFQPVIDVDTHNLVAIIGDTHHGTKPLSGLITWLQHYNIRKVALKQTIHHYPIFDRLDLM